MGNKSNQHKSFHQVHGKIMIFSVQRMRKATTWISSGILKVNFNSVTRTTSNCCWKSLPPWRPYGILSCKTFVQNNKMIFFIHRMDIQKMDWANSSQRDSPFKCPNRWPLFPTFSPQPRRKKHTLNLPAKNVLIDQ